MSETRTLVALLFEEQSESDLYVAPVGTGAGATIKIPNPVYAELALKEIGPKAEDEGVDLKDAVIAFRTPGGRLKVRQTKDLTAGKGAGGGTLMGFLVGLLFGGPLIGALGGLAIGALIGKRTDRGLDDDFVEAVSKKLQPGNSVLLLLIDRSPTEKGLSYLRSFNAELFLTEMSPEAEEAASQAAGDQAIVEAMQAEFDLD
jgi:uncharacterized membrane protein